MAIKTGAHACELNGGLEMRENLLDFVFSRRSIRSFTGETISESDITALLKAGFSAPSSKALYPCHFIVVTERYIFEEIMRFHDKAPALKTAPLAIIVCADTEKSPLSWRDDCAAATMNIIYAAHALGICSCWHGIYPREHRIVPAKQLFSLPKEIEPYSILALGYAQEPKPKRERYDENAVHRGGRW